MGLGSGPGIWADVELVGDMEGSAVGEGPEVPRVCTPGGPHREMEGLRPM